MQMKRLVAAALSSLVLAGCGGGDPCNQPNPCKQDPQPTAAMIDECRSRLNTLKTSLCYNEAVTVQNCTLASRVCTASGTTDTSATFSKAGMNCQREASAYSMCCSSNRTAAACAGTQ